ncbi:ABC transporter permease [Belnapia rosea]|uniref:ABC transporter permease n=1 Tax=Belnapia rosea TaxID=938405 RepID=UPI000886709E|nr:iron ABC transporter permease [Belnapia rosea]SDB57388.1 iron(III) transport system permease protein [Belnapia rosea]
MARRPGPGRAPAWALLALPLAALVAAPLLAVLAAAAVPSGAAWRHIAGTTLPEMLANSALLVLGVGAIAASIGTLAAWLVTACRFPGRRVLEVALLLPMAMPAYVCGYAYTWLLDVAGPVQTALRAATGLRWGGYWFPEIRSLPGAAMMLGLVLYPYVYLLCRNAFQQQSLGLIEAARTLGQSLTGCFFRLALPMARPAIAGGVALALMETLADFGTVQHFGVRTFTTGLYEAWFGLGDRGAASQLAACLMGLVALLLAFEHLSRGGRRFHPTTARQQGLRPVPLRGWWAAAALIACALPVALGFLVPAGTLLVLMLQVGDPLAPDRFLPFARNSLLLAGLAALLAVALAAFLAWAARLHPGGPQRAALRVAGLGYAIPGSVIAVGTLVPLGLFDNALDGWMRARFGLSTGLLLSGGIAALVFAYLVRFLAVALSAVEAGLARLRPSLREAARILGTGPAGAVLRVELPLARGSLLTAGLLVFVDTMKELPATLIIRPFDFDTLAVRVHNLAADERLAEASTAALLIVAAGLLPVLALTRALRKA